MTKTNFKLRDINKVNYLINLNISYLLLDSIKGYFIN